MEASQPARVGRGRPRAAGLGREGDRAGVGGSPQSGGRSGMPAGSYLIGEDRREDFRCAPGPLGWRYHSTVADIVCDDTHRLLRLTPAGGPTITAARLADGDPVLRWPADLWTPAPGPDDGPGPSDGDLVIAADAVACGSVGSWVAMLRAVAPVGLDPVTGTLRVRPQDAARVERWRFERRGGRLEQGVAGLEEWVVTAPGRDERRLWIVGDVMVWASGLLAPDSVEVTHLEGAPSWQPVSR